MFYVTGFLFWSILAILFLCILHDYLYNYSNRAIRVIYVIVFDFVALPFFIINATFFKEEKLIRVAKHLHGNAKYQAKVMLRYVLYRLKRKGIELKF